MAQLRSPLSLSTLSGPFRVTVTRVRALRPLCPTQVVSLQRRLPSPSRARGRIGPQQVALPQGLRIRRWRIAHSRRAAIEFVLKTQTFGLKRAPRSPPGVAGQALPWGGPASDSAVGEVPRVGCR